MCSTPSYTSPAPSGSGSGPWGRDRGQGGGTNSNQVPAPEAPDPLSEGPQDAGSTQVGGGGGEPMGGGDDETRVDRSVATGGIVSGGAGLRM